MPARAEEVAQFSQEYPSMHHSARAALQTAIDREPDLKVRQNLEKMKSDTPRASHATMYQQASRVSVQLNDKKEFYKKVVAGLGAAVVLLLVGMFGLTLLALNLSKETQFDGQRMKTLGNQDVLVGSSEITIQNGELVGRGASAGDEGRRLDHGELSGRQLDPETEEEGGAATALATALSTMALNMKAMRSLVGDPAYRALFESIRSIEFVGPKQALQVEYIQGITFPKGSSSGSGVTLVLQGGDSMEITPDDAWIRRTDGLKHRVCGEVTIDRTSEQPADVHATVGRLLAARLEGEGAEEACEVSGSLQLPTGAWTKMLADCAESVLTVFGPSLDRLATDADAAPVPVSLGGVLHVFAHEELVEARAELARFCDPVACDSAAFRRLPADERDSQVQGSCDDSLGVQQMMEMLERDANSIEMEMLLGGANASRQLSWEAELYGSYCGPGHGLTPTSPDSARCCESRDYKEESRRRAKNTGCPKCETMWKDRLDECCYWHDYHYNVLCRSDQISCDQSKKYNKFACFEWADRTLILCAHNARNPYSFFSAGWWDFGFWQTAIRATYTYVDGFTKKDECPCRERKDIQSTYKHSIGSKKGTCWAYCGANWHSGEWCSSRTRARASCGPRSSVPKRPARKA